MSLKMIIVIAAIILMPLVVLLLTNQWNWIVLMRIESAMLAGVMWNLFIRGLRKKFKQNEKGY